MIGTFKLGKEVLFGPTTENSSEEATITEITNNSGTDETTTETEVVKTTTDETTDEDKTSSDNVTSFNLDVSDIPTPIESPPKTPELPPIVVGYNPRKVGRYNLRPNLRSNASPDFRMLDSITTEDLRQTHH